MTIPGMSYFALEPADLNDHELREATSICRGLYDHGGIVPLATLQRCEAEMNRRFGGETTVFAEAPGPKGQKRWFERWLR
jgi:hypothetical protein